MSSSPKPEPVKVVDRRRFNPDGSPIVDPAVAAQPSAGAPVDPQAPRPTPSMRDVKIDELTQQLEAARKRVDELARAYQASERDREDFKVRLTREREQMLDVDRGNNAVLLIEAVDELDLILAASPERSPLRDGVQLVRDNLIQKLVAAGVERVELLNTTYDPNLAEAADLELAQSPADDGRITAVVKGGYTRKGRVIRPGRVRVARFIQPAQA